ncbi:MAG TPA: DUF2071 domain-containing protein [Candidatus Limnocylindrales bacterium]|jgi:hypothetical protein|nr:DUF2071 domain-containing protein [Candidatus Limnocylindrales bacterium]
MALALSGGGVRTPRTLLGWLDVTTILEQFALVTFDVDPSRLRAVLPVGLEPEVRTLDDGRTRGFVSAVSFRDVDFRFAVAPWLRVSFFQTNYRAYVRGPDGRQAVHFFGTTLDSPLVAMPSRLWGMPWHPGRTSIESSWTADGVCDGYRHVCSGRWGKAEVELVGSADPLGRLDGFDDAEDAAHILTHPLDGWFERPDRRLGRYAVWHPRMSLRMGSARRASYAVFEDLGLVEAGAVPHSVLLTRSIEFDVLLPPRLA